MPPPSQQSTELQSAMQSRFRVNPKQTYSERMSETRGEIRRLMKEALRAITGDENAAMRWPTFPRDVIERYRVTIVGWPDEVPFRNLSDVSNLPKLDILLRGWNDQSIRFQQISGDEVPAECSRWASYIAHNVGTDGDLSIGGDDGRGATYTGQITLQYPRNG